MGKVYFSDPIDHISGKIADRFQTVYYHRGPEGKNKNGTNYTAAPLPRDTDKKPYSEDELEQQAKFKELSEAVNEMYKDKDNRSEHIKEAEKKGLTLRQLYWEVAKGNLTLDDSGSGPGSGTGGGNQGGDDDPDGGGSLS